VYMGCMMFWFVKCIGGSDILGCSLFG
jgi:hypothetical protein